MVTAVLFSACVLVQATPPKDAFLYTELVGMEMADQEVRDRYVEAIRQNRPITIELVREMHRVDAANRSRLKEIIRDHGWPTKSLVGEEAANAAWLIVQHADDDVAFQETVLKILQPLINKGEVAKKEYAYLWDRVATNQKRKQRYGTQGKIEGDRWILGPTEDMRNLDKRRASMGLLPMSEYYKVIKEMLGIKSAGPA